MNLLREKMRLLPMSGPQDMGGGGGGGSAPANTTSTQTADLPDWAKGYAQNVLAKGQALTDISNNPYKQYGGQRVAGFTGLQNQSFNEAANLGPNALTAYGGLNALTAGQNYQRQATNPNATAAYMSPYVENALIPQIAAANRQYDITGMQQRAGATQAGAYGGGRDAIMRMENERARQSALQGITAKGYQDAFTNAQQAQQFGANLGLQGAQAAAGAGQNLFNQATGAIQLQNQMGAQQQALAQKQLDINYQNFMDQQNYPYQQLSYMANLVRGTPMGMNTSSQVYQAPGSQLGQLAGLGAMAYGLSKAEGGTIKSYNKGGLSVTDKFNDPSAMLSEMDKLSDEQLQAILKAPATRAEAQAAQEELAQRASEDRGMASAWEQVPYSNRQNIIRAAGGGILAFKDEGLVKKSSWEYDLEDMANPEDVQTRPDNSSAWGALKRGFLYNSDVAAKEKAADAARDDARALTEFDRATDDYMTARADKAKAANKGISAPGGKSGPRASGITASPAGTSTTPAANGGISSYMSDLKMAREALRDPETEAATKSLNALIAKQGERAGKLKDQAMSDFLVNYGAAMAQSAAQPGQARSPGLAGLLQTAAAAAPAGAQSIARSKAAIAAAEDNNLKMQLEMQKYNIAMRKGDLQTATSLAANIRMMQQQQAQLGEMIRHNKASEGLMQSKIAAGNTAYESTLLRSKSAIAQSAMKQAAKDWADPLKVRELKAQYGSQKEYANDLFKQQWSQAMPQLSYLGTLGGDDTGG